MKEEDKAVRITGSLTSAWEKENLPKIAERLPGWVTPDHLTMLGIAAALVVGLGYVLSHYSRLWLLLSVAGLFLHWFGDSLDGTLARVRKCERERYGYYVDRTADAISVVVICIAFGLSPFVSLGVAMLLAVGYLLIMIYAEICAYTSGRFPMSFAMLGPTEARMLLALFTLGLVFWTPGLVGIGPFTASVLDLFGLGVAALLFVSFVVLSSVEARRLDRLEKLSKRAPGGSAESWL